MRISRKNWCLIDQNLSYLAVAREGFAGLSALKASVLPVLTSTYSAVGSAPLGQKIKFPINVKFVSYFRTYLA